MIADIINKLRSDGTLDILLKHGVVPARVFVQHEMYKHYKDELIKNKHCKDCKMISITRTADKFKMEQTTIYRAIKIMEA